jgi:hypothetical protein
MSASSKSTTSTQKKTRARRKEEKTNVVTPTLVGDFFLCGEIMFNSSGLLGPAWTCTLYPDTLWHVLIIEDQ